MNDNMYYFPTIMYQIIENRLSLRMNEIRKIVDSSKIKLTEEEIKEYLDKRLMIENPNLKEIMKKNLEGENNELDVESAVERFMAQLEYRRYEYLPYTYKYYNNYIRILKNKCNNILKIMDGIADNTINQEVLNELDINLDEKGNILGSDVVRLTEPFIYNYKELVKKHNEGNILHTYLHNKISLDDIFRKGLTEQELYPKEELQENNINLYESFDRVNGSIPLTNNQKKLLKTKHDEFMKDFIYFIGDKL